MLFCWFYHEVAHFSFKGCLVIIVSFSQKLLNINSEDAGQMALSAKTGLDLHCQCHM